MLDDLTPTQRELAEFMSHLSERAYRAAWMFDVERELWAAMQVPGGHRAPMRLSAEEVHRLKELSVRCGGWIAFDDDREETFVPLAEWEVRFAARP